jgi:hypothetical protein
MTLRRTASSIGRPRICSRTSPIFFTARARRFIIATNQSTGGTDFRFYLDLNRNGQFDTNGLVTNVDNGNNPIPRR